MNIMFDMPDFTTVAEAIEVLDELADNSEEVQYTDKRGWRVTRARNRLNGYWKRFLSRCGRLQAKHDKKAPEYTAWGKVLKSGEKTQKSLIAMKDRLGELEGIF